MADLLPVLQNSLQLQWGDNTLLFWGGPATDFSTFRIAVHPGGEAMNSSDLGDAVRSADRR